MAMATVIAAASVQVVTNSKDAAKHVLSLAEHSHVEHTYGKPGTNVAKTRVAGNIVCSQAKIHICKNIHI